MKLLHIDSSIQGENSASRALSAAVVERLRSTSEDIDIAYRDLVTDPLPHLTIDAVATLAENPVLEQFLESDIVVIGAALYNLTIPTQLKAWLDRIIVAGRTFSYSEAGPQGLAGDKRVIVALARGNVYSEGTPSSSLEHAETLLRSLFTFIGVRNLEFVIAEGLAFGEEPRRAALAAALEQAAQIAPSR